MASKLLGCRRGVRLTASSSQRRATLIGLVHKKKRVYLFCSVQEQLCIDDKALTSWEVPRGFSQAKMTESWWPWNTANRKRKTERKQVLAFMWAQRLLNLL